MSRSTLSALALLVCVPLTLAACTTATETDVADPGVPRGGEPVAGTEKPGDAAALVPEKIKDKGEIAFAHDATYPPFEYFDKDNTTMIGFDVQLADAIAGKLGVKAKHVNTGFDTILAGLSSGKFDVGMSAFTITPGRAKSVDFVQYFSGGTAIAVPKGNPKKLSLYDLSLCGHKVSAQKGSDQGLNQMPAIDTKCKAAGKPGLAISLYPSQNDANLALTSGRVDAIAADTISLAYQGKLAKGAFELAPGEPYEPAAAGIALAKNSPLTPAVAGAVTELSADGTLQKLGAAWSLPAQVFTADDGKVTK
ncbi:MAG: ABC transporter substrate-binding protein [Humibacillus sp.]|nr:ABC transporter substrate-binding protein [Humibacillus sp.]MDN5775604.1 ABC transporter substrate-binding protein [Humibacillus sp.]